MSEAVKDLVEVAQRLGGYGYFPATSGNLSIRESGETLRMRVSVSGIDKTRLTEGDLLLVDEHLQSTEQAARKPSAEAIVHVQLYQKSDAMCILHVHTISNNLITLRYDARGSIPLSGNELLKALGHWEEDARVNVPLVENYSDLTKLATAVAAAYDPAVPGVLVKQHGIYVLGRSVAEALRHLEAFEFLFSLTLQRAALTPLATAE